MTSKSIPVSVIKISPNPPPFEPTNAKTDVVLVTEGKEFRVHRSHIIQCHPFQQLGEECVANLDFSPSDSSFRFPGGARGLEVCLKWLYKPQKKEMYECKPEDLCHALAAADYLGSTMEDAIDDFRNAWLRWLSAENVFQEMLACDAYPAVKTIGEERFITIIRKNKRRFAENLRSNGALLECCSSSILTAVLGIRNENIFHATVEDSSGKLELFDIITSSPTVGADQLKVSIVAFLKNDCSRNLPLARIMEFLKKFQRDNDVTSVLCAHLAGRVDGVVKGGYEPDFLSLWPATVAVFYNNVTYENRSNETEPLLLRYLRAHSYTENITLIITVLEDTKRRYLPITSAQLVVYLTERILKADVIPAHIPALLGHISQRMTGLHDNWDAVDRILKGMNFQNLDQLQALLQYSSAWSTPPETIFVKICNIAELLKCEQADFLQPIREGLAQALSKKVLTCTLNTLSPVMTTMVVKLLEWEESKRRLLIQYLSTCAPLTASQVESLLSCVPVENLRSRQAWELCVSIGKFENIPTDLVKGLLDVMMRNPAKAWIEQSSLPIDWVPVMIDASAQDTSHFEFLKAFCFAHCCTGRTSTAWVHLLKRFRPMFATADLVRVSTLGSALAPSVYQEVSSATIVAMSDQLLQLNTELDRIRNGETTAAVETATTTAPVLGKRKVRRDVEEISLQSRIKREESSP